ncbi:MAG: glycoside hydrolase family 99-like domain-containing protein [Proteobacteria bacterium]|nr:glycoside hydrolase family 99-like domain-containing protein [Pseudomonadota bacterium]
MRSGAAPSPRLTGRAFPPAVGLQAFLCPNPFLYAELRPDGAVSPCCYLNMTIGNVREASLQEVWNSPQAQGLRASILDGSYRFCDVGKCAGMQKALQTDQGRTAPPRYQLPYELLRREELRGTEHAWIEQWTPETAAPPPVIISLEDDSSCNLSCPSCRKAPHALPLADSARLEPVHQDLLRQLDASGGELWLCGAGDPFASRAYRKLLQTFDPAAHPLVRFRIDTNAVLLTPEMWDKTLGRYPERVSLLAVSIDAAEAGTYERLRHGGDFGQLKRNLAFLGQRRLEHPNLRLILRMIVQRDNFRQMHDFVALARSFHADRIVFSALGNWGSFTAETWEDLAVHRPQNLYFEELLTMLRDTALNEQDIDLGNLTALLDHPRPRQEAASSTPACACSGAPDPFAEGLVEKRALAIAFHLPQFHPIPENDEWWGKGFTEWTNTAKAVPLFEGHYQPHVPADLGFYDLRLPEARAAQARMAAEYGVDAFLYWHYWFGNGRRLLERPVDEMVRSGQPDFPFCLGWANQTWSGIWHGAPNRVLMEQLYPGQEDYRAHFEALMPAFADPRYLKIEGRNLFLVYNPSGLPDATAFTAFWRELARAQGLPDFHFVEHGGCVWVGRGFDSCVANAPFIDFNDKTADVRFHDPDHAPTVREYADYVRHMAGVELGPGEHPLGINGWDNTPRSGGRGHALHGSTPELFEAHLESLVRKIAHRPKASRILFLKSWNEWAEGNHLEPDLRWGCRYLEVLRNVLYKKPDS